MLLFVASAFCFPLPQEDSSSDERHLTIAVSSSLFTLKDSTEQLSAGSNGKLTAQLFSDSGGGQPIWTEVTFESVTFPADKTTAIVLVLGNKESLNAIEMADLHWLLLTFESGGKTYSSPRLSLSRVGFAHEAEFAKKPRGLLKATVDDYELRIKALEDAREVEFAALKKAFLQLRKDTMGTPASDGIEGIGN